MSTQEIQSPLILSVPHSGIFIPKELRTHFDQNLISHPKDTDWFVDQLYDFAKESKLIILKANYSRWVIDLNRDPQNAPLYSDGRWLTGVAPITSFDKTNLYSSEYDLNSLELQKRIDHYHTPYYKKCEELLKLTKEKFGYALLWDCHSIKRLVPTIRKEPFPDMILGSNDHQSCPEVITQKIFETLKNGWNTQLNDPFKGGFITRFFGRPKDNIFALQLEMSQDLYMDEQKITFDLNKASLIQETLKKALSLFMMEAEKYHDHLSI